MDSKFSKLKKTMGCGEVKKSWRKHKKIVKKVCADGKQKLVHAGDDRYRNDYSDKARKSFKARHKCSEKKSAFSAQKLACEELW